MTNREKISVVVVTYKRLHALERCLQSLSNQSLPIHEVIVVNNDLTSSKDVRQLVDDAIWGPKIHVIDNDVNSLARGRNIGVSAADGGLVLLVDDDVRLFESTVEELYRVFADFPDTVGCQGLIEEESSGIVRELTHRSFFLYHHEKDRCRVLPSISTTYPSELSRTTNCEWISGSLQLYRREVLETIQWDEKLLKYCDGEDLDHSYRVYLKYPHGLRICPEARVHHDAVEDGRVPNSTLILMQEVYGWYLHKKLFSSGFRNRCIYLWSRVGKISIDLVMALLNRDASRLVSAKMRIQAYLFVFKRSDQIADGNLTSFNELLNLRN